MMGLISFHVFVPPATKLGQGNIFRSVCQQFCPQGGTCVVAWGDVCGFIWGGMHGFIQGACMVLFGGACVVLFWGACVVFSVFSDTMRYGQ